MEKNILEMGLPVYLQKDIDALIAGEKDPDCTVLDCLYDEVYGSINSAFHGHEITDEQAKFLRKKYLGI